MSYGDYQFELYFDAVNGNLPRMPSKYDILQNDALAPTPRSEPGRR